MWWGAYKSGAVHKPAPKADKRLHKQQFRADQRLVDWTFSLTPEDTTQPHKMNVEDFRKNGKEMIDYICDYVGGVGDRRVTPAIEPGYLRPLLPTKAPQKPESFADIMADVEEKIMPGVTHWQHPRFHAYFPSGNSFPSILGDMLSDAIGCIGFSWAASPACTELETIVLDWLGQAIGLPEEFLAFTEGGKGGGVIQTCASECILVCMLAAREQAIQKLKLDNPNGTDGELLNTLVAYCSKEAHSCVEKAAKICMVKLRILDPDNQCSLRGNTVRAAMQADMENGLTPFFVSTTLGSTSCCSFDNLTEIGPVCTELDVWMHVDSAYAGNAFICEEFKPLMRGIEHASSFNTNPNKWLLTNFDCSTMWVRDRFKLTQALVVDPLYLQHTYSAQSIDYRHWGVPLSRRFRALKLWFVLRSYGIDGLQRYIRNHCRLAKRFEQHVLKDSHFEVANDVKMGLVCFRLKGDDKMTMELLAKINSSGQLHMIPARVNERYIIRFCVTAEHASENDIDFAWAVVKDMATEILEDPDNKLRRKSMLKKRLSFVRSVSREIFQRSTSRSSLYDGCSPIIVLDENNVELKEDVFTFAPMKEELNEDIKSK